MTSWCRIAPDDKETHGTASEVPKANGYNENEFYVRSEGSRI